MELRLLNYFLAVAEELHFGNAAKKLHISQPPLSRQIQELEKQLGCVLFMRTKRKVELTDEGNYLLQEVHQLFQNIDQIELT
jgi:DNA-binding transcriptional LysR family regulator